MTIKLLIGQGGNAPETIAAEAGAVVAIADGETVRFPDVTVDKVAIAIDAQDEVVVTVDQVDIHLHGLRAGLEQEIDMSVVIDGGPTPLTIAALGDLLAWTAGSTESETLSSTDNSDGVLWIDGAESALVGESIESGVFFDSDEAAISVHDAVPGFLDTPPLAMDDILRFDEAHHEVAIDMVSTTAPGFPEDPFAGYFTAATIGGADLVWSALPPLNATPDAPFQSNSQDLDSGVFAGIGVTGLVTPASSIEDDDTFDGGTSFWVV